MMPKYHYGCRPDRPDQRDHLYVAPYEILQALPPVVDLRPGFPEPPYDQLALGSCVSNAVAGAVQFLMAKEDIPEFMPSRLFIYYDGRLQEGTVNSDAGESVRDGIKTVVSHGVCPESEWPYDISAFTEPPPVQCYSDAKLTLALQYQRIWQNLTMMLACLASGYPFLVGISVYESFESQQVAQTGMVPMPQWGERLLGGHCVAVVGYDNTQQRFLCRNSWGTSWGQQGYFTIDYGYLTNYSLASDVWTIRQVS